MHENVLSLTLLLSVKVPFICTPLKSTSSHSGTLQSRKSTPPKNYTHSTLGGIQCSSKYSQALPKPKPNQNLHSQNPFK